MERNTRKIPEKQIGNTGIYHKKAKKVAKNVTVLATNAYAIGFHTGILFSLTLLSQTAHMIISIKKNDCFSGYVEVNICYQPISALAVIGNNINAKIKYSKSLPIFFRAFICLIFIVTFLLYRKSTDVTLSDLVRIS